MKKIIALGLSLLMTANLATTAKITNNVAGVIIEGQTIKLRGHGLNSKNNPAKLSFITLDGQEFDIPLIKKKNTRVKFKVPSVNQELIKGAFKFTGGTVKTDAPQIFVTQILNDPFLGESSDTNGAVSSTVTGAGTTILDAYVDENGDLIIVTDQGEINLGGVAGATGEAGPSGPQGPTGATGATGPQGPKGENGVACWDLNANGVGDDLNGAPGDEDLNNDNVVDVLDCTGAQGVQGPVGPIGPQGIQGIQGPVGPVGAQGPQGIQGIQVDNGIACWDLNANGVGDDLNGAPGDEDLNNDDSVDVLDCQGTQGIQGPVGPIGPQGIQGIQGPVGPVGAQGPQGIQGIQGDNGIACWDLNANGVGDDLNGAPGDEDLNNDDSVDVLDCTGPVGPQGAQGLQGPQGIQGIQGPVGPVGAQGPQGIQGIQGDNGIACWDLNANGVGDDLNGAPGDEDVNNDDSVDVLDCTGPVGPQGAQGLLGPQGPVGPQGAQGPAGPQGAVGQACWDLNYDGIKNLPDEDINIDGIVDINDCRPERIAGVVFYSVTLQVTEPDGDEFAISAEQSGVPINVLVLQDAFPAANVSDNNELSQIDGGELGQLLIVLFTDHFTIRDAASATLPGANILLSGSHSPSQNLGPGSSAQLIFDGTNWVEVSVSSR